LNKIRLAVGRRTFVVPVLLGRAGAGGGVRRAWMREFALVGVRFTVVEGLGGEDGGVSKALFAI